MRQCAICKDSFQAWVDLGEDAVQPVDGSGAVASDVLVEAGQHR